MSSATATMLAIACLALAACGGDDDEPPVTGGGAEAPEASAPGSGADASQQGSAASEEEEQETAGAGDERAIRAAVEDAIASGDPQQACGAAVTEAYLRDTYGNAAGCRGAQSEGFAADTVEVGEISIDGDLARTAIRAEGGPYAGERLRARLVREGEGWKLDRLRSNVPPGP